MKELDPYLSLLSEITARIHSRSSSDELELLRQRVESHLSSLVQHMAMIQGANNSDEIIDRNAALQEHLEALHFIFDSLYELICGYLSEKTQGDLKV